MNCSCVFNTIVFLPWFYRKISVSSAQYRVSYKPPDVLYSFLVVGKSAFFFNDSHHIFGTYSFALSINLEYFFIYLFFVKGVE